MYDMKEPVFRNQIAFLAKDDFKIVYTFKTIFWILPDIVFIRICFIYISLYTFILHSRSLMQILKIFMFTTKYVNI